MLNLKVSVPTAADGILILVLLYFSDKVRFDMSCESPVR